jgi:hypothetical protein
MNLSTEVKESVIIFFDGSRKFVTKNQADFIITESTGSKKGIVIDGSFRTFSSISKVLAISEFYQEYPEEQPNLIQRWEEPREYISIEKKAWSKTKWLKGLIAGLKEYIDEKGGIENCNQWTRETIAKWENRLLELNK